MNNVDSLIVSMNVSFINPLMGLVWEMVMKIIIWKNIFNKLYHWFIPKHKNIRCLLFLETSKYCKRRACVILKKVKVVAFQATKNYF